MGINNISFCGKIKYGDISRKLRQAGQKIEKTTDKLEANTARLIDQSAVKILDNPEKPTAKDIAKLTTIGSSAATSTATGISNTITTYENTWPIYSTIFPSSF